MLDNKTYDLMIQLIEENKSLWRIKNEYLNNCSGDEKCTAFWQKMEKDKEDHVNELTELVKENLS